MTRRRAWIGAAIVVAWIAGLLVLIQREYFRPQLQRLAEGASRVAPGAVYYAVMQGDRQVGFASSTIDTVAGAITVSDYLVADLPVGGTVHRTSARVNVRLSRALHMTLFGVSVEGEGAPIRANGTVDGDSVVQLAIRAGTEQADSERIAIAGPVFLPNLVPLAAAMTERPHLGARYAIPVLDPVRKVTTTARIEVRAESLVTLYDSATFDSTSRRWRVAIPDTVRVWRFAVDSGPALSGWIDQHGRVVQTSLLGFTLRRLPYEVAFENWRNDGTSAAVPSDRDLVETTAIAANTRLGKRVDSLRVRLAGVALDGFALDGGGQQLSGDTLVLTRLGGRALAAGRLLPYPERDAGNARPEPLIQSTAPAIAALAARISDGARDPLVVARRINQWVHDSIADHVTLGAPSALQVLATRTGDCNEHTQLFVALARAAGLPSRSVAGLAYVDGKFYYHAWPEILLGDWVPVDPTFGQFPADAAHLRFVIGGLARQTELLRLMGTLQINVLSVNQRPGGQPSGGRHDRE